MNREIVVEVCMPVFKRSYNKWSKKILTEGNL
jgi:hypothetical protein